MSQMESAPNRVDAIVKVSGAARYAADAKPAGMLFALALRSPAARGRIKAFRLDAARNLPGVRAIFTHEDRDRLGWGSSPEVDALSGEVLGRAAMADAASQLPAYRPLLDAEIFFAGQWIAIVVAEQLEQARAALNAIEVDIERSEAERPDAVLPGPFFAGDMQHARDDQTDAGPEAVHMKATYSTPPQLHHPMEPSATTAVWDGDRVTLYDSTQGTQATRDYIARSLGIEPDKVRVLAPYVGGGFGSKNQIWPHQALAAHMARVLARPVRLQLTRPDMGVASGYRSETIQEVELAADALGRLKLLRHVSTMPTSLRGGFFEPCGLNSLMLYKAGRIEVSHRVERRAVATPTPFRAPGETPGSFALETALDELAVRLRMSPIDLRISNHADMDLYHQRPWSSNNLLECYRQGAERFGWPAGYIEPRSMTRGDLRIGFGMATTAYPAPALPASVRLVLRMGSALLVETSATDIGTGLRTILTQTVAEGLGIDTDRIEVRLGDSSLPNAPTAGRSKLTASVLPAAAQACRLLLQELECIDPVPAGDNATGPFERLERCGRREIVVEARSTGLPRDVPLSFYSFGAHFVKVEIDELIGRLRVKRIVSALDCGHIVNRKLAESQIRGGIIFGIGMALMEDAGRRAEDLRLLNDNLADYAVPVHADIPPIEVLFLEKPDPAISDIGARGIGEIGLPGLAAAIGNAVFNAVGRRCRSLPIPLATLAARPPRVDVEQ